MWDIKEQVQWPFSYLVLAHANKSSLHLTQSSPSCDVNQMLTSSIAGCVCGFVLASFC